jgi:hypothetical protein
MPSGLTAAVLFDIVLGTFTQWQTVCGKLVGALEPSFLHTSLHRF